MPGKIIQMKDNGIDAYPISAIKGAVAPTNTTVGFIGQMYVVTTSPYPRFVCVAISGSNYTWKKIADDTFTQEALENRYEKDANVTIADGEIGTKSYQRLTGFAILKNTSLDNVKYTGQYGVDQSCTSRPVTDVYGILEVIMYTSQWLIQRYYALNGAGAIVGTYYRSFYGGSTWTAWRLDSMSAVANASLEE